MSSRRHSACCCVRLDDWIYKCACGKSKWKCGSRIAITGKWLILGLLDVATIAISIALVVVRIFFPTNSKSLPFKLAYYMLEIGGYSHWGSKRWCLFCSDIWFYSCSDGITSDCASVERCRYGLFEASLLRFGVSLVSVLLLQQRSLSMDALRTSSILVLWNLGTLTCTLQCRSFFDQHTRCRIGGVRGESWNLFWSEHEHDRSSRKQHERVILARSGNGAPSERGMLSVPYVFFCWGCYVKTFNSLLLRSQNWRSGTDSARNLEHLGG